MPVANYLDSSVLCESYIYIDEYTLTDERKTLIQQALTGYANTRAPLFFGAEILVDTEITEGSLKAKVTVVGSILLLITQYGNLRTGIDYMYKDAQLIAGALVAESVFAAGVRRPDVSHTEVRTGVPGALKRVLGRIDNLAGRSAAMTPADFSEELAGIRAELLRIIDMIPSQEDKKAVADGFAEILQNQYPAPPGGDPIYPGGEPPAPVVRRNELDAFFEELRRAGNPPANP